MSTNYADNATYESPSQKRDRHVDVQWSLCRATANAPRQDGNVRRHVRRDSRVQKINLLWLGDWRPDSCPRRTPQNCQSVWHFDSKIASERVIFGENLGNPEKFFLYKTLENKGSNDFQGKILEKIRFLRISPVDKSAKCGYNVGMMNGKNTRSQKTGLESEANTRKPLVTKLTPVDQLPSTILPRRVFLTRDSSQHPQGRKTRAS